MRGKHSSYIDRTGEIHFTNQGYRVIITECIDARNCTIEFDNGYIKRNIPYKVIKSGEIKNLYHPTVFGKGYTGEGKYKRRYADNPTDDDIKWTSMLRRSYSTVYQKNKPTYKGCSVDERWHNFQVFAEWYENNNIKNWELDKDILIKGNKIYSPETCCFVPAEINILFIKGKSGRGKYPIGVTLKNKKYLAQLSKNGDQEDLGYFDTTDEAFNTYKIAKEEWIKEVANKWRGEITERCYHALINYKVEITD